jgi:hypothetical protein
MIQPLSGEYAGRRTLLESIPFFTGYAVEIGHLIVAAERLGIEGLGQVDLERRVHRNQELEGLSRMSFVILQAVMKRLEERAARAPDRWGRMADPGDRSAEPEIREVGDMIRPDAASAYRARRGSCGFPAPGGRARTFGGAGLGRRRSRDARGWASALPDDEIVLSRWPTAEANAGDRGGAGDGVERHPGGHLRPAGRDTTAEWTP